MGLVDDGEQVVDRATAGGRIGVRRPQRVEGGWWHRLPAGGEFADGACAQTAGPLVPQTVVRDYWVGWSERAGVLWLFSTRLAGESTAWFLHGVFA